MPSYIQEFITYMKIRTRILTQYNYLLDYRNFLEWLIRTGRSIAEDISQVTIVDFESLSFIDLQEYFSYLVDGYDSHREYSEWRESKVASCKPNGPGLKRKRASLNSLFSYLYAQRGLITKNEMSKFANQFKDIQRSTNHIYLSEEEVIRLFKAVGDLSDLEEPYLTRTVKNQIRDWAIIVTFLDTGIRVSTLAALNIRDIDFEKKEITLKLKGGKEKRLPILDTALGAIRVYLNNKHRPKPKNPDAELAVFLSSWGNRMSVKAIQAMVKKYIVKAGLNYDFSVHSLRHTFGTNFYNATGDINLTADFLCHSSPATASKFYAGIKDETRETALEKLPNYTSFKDIT